MSADRAEPAGTSTLEDPLAEGLRIVEVGQRHGLLIRLMGGMAVRAHAPDWPARARTDGAPGPPGRLSVGGSRGRVCS